MKKQNFWSILMLMLMAMPLLVACGGDDDNDNTTPTPTEEYISPKEALLREICKVFSLNRADYEEYYEVSNFMKASYNGEDVTDKRAVAMINKNTKKLFVGVYNIKTKEVLLKNNEESVDEIMTVTHYEDKLDCPLSDIYLNLVERKNSYFLLAQLTYNNSSKNLSKFVPIIYCSKGNFKKIIEDNSFWLIEPWSDNSCFCQLSDWYGFIFTEDGDLFEIRGFGQTFSGLTISVSFEYLYPTNEIYFLSCYDLIDFHEGGRWYSGDEPHFFDGKKIIYRANLLDKKIMWYVSTPLFSDLPKNVNYKKTVESKELNNDILTANFKAVAESGEVYRETIKVNINTGEIVN